MLDHAMDFQDNQQSESDKRLLVVFYVETIRNESKSIEAGRPIFDEIDHIRILTPGSKDTFVTEVNQGYIERFPQQWARYKAKQEQHASGTLLSELPWMTRSQVAELNAVNCMTVEQLVGMQDSLASKFMGYHQLKQRAQSFLDAAAGAAPALKLQAELDKRDEQIAELQAQMKAMLAAQKAEQAAKVPLKA
jgi:hypothetical protein